MLDAGPKTGKKASSTSMDAGLRLRRALVPPSSDSDASEASSELSTAFAWAGWPMPSPPTESLPNPRSYSNDSEEVVKDNVTDLEWQRGLDDGTYSWDDAFAYCANLSLAGGGFRLPSRIELLSLIAVDRATPTIDIGAFPNTPPDKLWSSSRFAGASDRAWGVDFGFSDGHVFTDPMRVLHRVRCVR